MDAADVGEIPLEIKNCTCLISTEVDKAEDKVVDELNGDRDESSSVWQLNYLIDQHILARTFHISLIKNHHTEM